MSESKRPLGDVIFFKKIATMDGWDRNRANPQSLR